MRVSVSDVIVPSFLKVVLPCDCMMIWVSAAFVSNELELFQDPMKSELNSASEYGRSTQDVSERSTSRIASEQAFIA